MYNIALLYLTGCDLSSGMVFSCFNGVHNAHAGNGTRRPDLIDAGVDVAVNSVTLPQHDAKPTNDNGGSSVRKENFMTGSPQIKNGKYYMVLNRSVNGKRKQQWVSTGLPEKGNNRRTEQTLRETLAKESCVSFLPPVGHNGLGVCPPVVGIHQRPCRRSDIPRLSPYGHGAYPAVL